MREDRTDGEPVEDAGRASRRARVASVAMAAFVLGSCLVTRGSFEREAARAEQAEAVSEQRGLRIEALEQRVADLMKTRENLELERVALEEERLGLIEGLEQLRSGNETLELELAQERHLRAQREAEIAEVSNTYRGLVEELEKEVRAGHVEIHRLRGRLQLRALEAILFDSGSVLIKPGGEAVLAKIAEQVRRIPDHRVRVEGHTDSVPIATERFPSNWELSAARAAGVVRYLIAQGLDPARLSAVGLGPYEPIADNGTARGRAQNRRIEIVLVPDSGE